MEDIVTDIDPDGDPADTLVLRSGRSRPLRICMVTPRYAPHIGGTEIHTAQVAGALARRGHHVTVATTDPSGRLVEREMVGGVEVVRVRAYPRFGDLYLAPGLWSVIVKGGWDVVHVQGYHTAVAPLALAAGRRSGAALFATFHSGGHSSSLRSVLRPLQVKVQGRLLRSVDRLIGVSRFEADQFARWLDLDPGRVAVIPNGTDREAEAGTTEPARSGLIDPEADEVVILSLGRLVRYKGHQRVIEALPLIVEQVPSARLLILGQGPYEQSLRRLVERRGLTDRVTITHIPVAERPRLQAVLRDASVAVLMSDYESHGMAAHEALAAGTPLVVADGSALHELVVDGLARPVALRASAADVAEVVITALSQADRPRGTAADRTLEWSTVVDRIEGEYRRAVAAKLAGVGSWPASASSSGGTTGSGRP